MKFPFQSNKPPSLFTKPKSKAAVCLCCSLSLSLVQSSVAPCSIFSMCQKWLYDMMPPIYLIWHTKYGCVQLRECFANFIFIKNTLLYEEGGTDDYHDTTMMIVTSIGYKFKLFPNCSFARSANSVHSTMKFELICIKYEIVVEILAILLIEFRNLKI